MLNRKDQNFKAFFIKDFLNDQTRSWTNEKSNTDDIELSASVGMGSDDGDTTVVLMGMGGFRDQYASARLKFISPTVTGSEDIGICIRILTMDAPDAAYYYARADGGIAKLTRVSSGSFTNLSQSAFALAENQWCRITLQAVGNVLSASFVADGGTPAAVNLTAVDSRIPTGGSMCFRSMSSTVFCESFTGSQL